MRVVLVVTLLAIFFASLTFIEENSRDRQGTEYFVSKAHDTLGISGLIYEKYLMIAYLMVMAVPVLFAIIWLSLASDNQQLEAKNRALYRTHVLENYAIELEQKMTENVAVLEQKTTATETRAEELATKNDKRTTLQPRIEVLKQRQDEVAAKIAAFQEGGVDIQSLDLAAREAEEKLDKIEGKDLENEIESLEERLGEAEKRLESLAGVPAKLKKLYEKLTGLEKQEEALEGDDGIQATVESLVEAAEELENNLEEADVDGLEEQLGEAEERLANIDELSGRLKSLRNKFATLTKMPNDS